MSFTRTETRSGCCNALIVDVAPERGCLHFMEPPPRYACYRCDREVPRGFIMGWRIAEFSTITLPRIMEPSFVREPVSLAKLLTSVQSMKIDP